MTTGGCPEPDICGVTWGVTCSSGLSMDGSAGLILPGPGEISLSRTKVSCNLDLVEVPRLDSQGTCRQPF